MSEKTTESLEALRTQIDAVDQQLLDLLRQRLDLVKQVGHVKHEAGLPIYAPEREAVMLSKRRAEAEEIGVEPQLIEDVLRRLMRESYRSENKSGFKQLNPDCGDIVIIGGKGHMGQLFTEMFRLSGYRVRCLGEGDWEQAPKWFEQAGVIIVTVPISATCELIRQRLTELPPHCILADLTSIKSEPLQAMMKSHKGPVVGFHPMFGGDVKSLAKQIIVVCHGRGQVQYQWLIQQMEIWGASLVEACANEHDEAMQTVQALRHFSTFAYGVALFDSQADVEKLLQYSSPIYRLELAMVGRLFAQNPKLYADIIYAQTKSIEKISSYANSYQSLLSLLESGDREKFINKFIEVSNYLGDFAQQFQQESRVLLQSAADMINNR
ncbi:bifunctional chorismate mutase/prephenate dehydrogenase [Parashewanella curva]|uniref:T-protein n=1 Tax=Parashewanella curva TaxID=2338552 RepID=A0A3L8Q1E0_9GAMM|nr:bifunctional chorismate mutase/prephenate dehydrogenase [Parashewanella curva]RLV61451.1 bifunctional chorismate mutase/prephenate dehydrogenase [Parashewanella curva]